MADDELDLTSEERQVLEVLLHEGATDVIGLSSRTRLSVERVLDVVRGLAEREIIMRVEPEPVHERFASAARGPLQAA